MRASVQARPEEVALGKEPPLHEPDAVVDPAGERPGAALFLVSSALVLAAGEPETHALGTACFCWLRGRSRKSVVSLVVTLPTGQGSAFGT